MQKKKFGYGMGALIFFGIVSIAFFSCGVLAQDRQFQDHGRQRRHVSVCDSAESSGVRCHARVIVDDNNKPLAQTAPSGYGPTQYLAAYGISGSATSTLPIIAIVDAYDDANIQADLNTYNSTMGLPSLPACAAAIKNSTVPCFQKLNQTGQTKFYPRTNASWDLEIALDVQTAHAVCKNCRVALVEANSATYQDLMISIDTAVNLGANIVSGSWGGAESSGEIVYDTHFNKPGIIFTFSAGDSGYGTQYPAASQYVTAVGGTSLAMSGNAYAGETVWSGTNSGCSSYEAKPAWQKDATCKKRTMNDVSADADPNTGAAVYDSVSYMGSKGWFVVGGTSLAAPLIAGVYAQAPSANTPVGKTNTTGSIVYANGLSANGTINSARLHDVVSGSNGSCKGTYYCTAGVGYDAPTGLGTPNGSTAF